MFHQVPALNARLQCSITPLHELKLSVMQACLALYTSLLLLQRAIDMNMADLGGDIKGCASQLQTA